MKVLIATGLFPPEIGGPATYAHLLAQELPQRGIEIDVLPFSVVKGYPRILRHVIYFFKILSRSRGVDIIFSQDPVSTGLPAILAGKVIRKKVVLRIAGDYAWEQATQRYGVTDGVDQFQRGKYGFRTEVLRTVQSWVVLQADVVLSPSKYFAQLVSRWNDNARDILVIYNGIDLSVNMPRVDKFEEKTIITAGRLVPWKGIDTLIESLPLLPNWQLRVAGDGSDKSRLKDIANRLGVSSRVIFLGQLDKNNLYKEIARSHVFALLSTFESFSFQVVEAMHIGIPVVAADIGNISEIITDGVDGVLISPGDPEALVSAVDSIMADEKWRALLGDNARRRAAEFNTKDSISNLVKTFGIPGV